MRSLFIVSTRSGLLHTCICSTDTGQALLGGRFVSSPPVGQNVLAPADGKVVVVVDDQPNQMPGTPLAQSDAGAFKTLRSAGNHVVIRTAGGEFVFLARMQRGSARLAVGDSVQAGDENGLIGNFGNTSEPYLQIQGHAQDVAGFFDPNAVGLPLLFSNSQADADPVAHGELVQEQFVEPAPLP